MSEQMTCPGFKAAGVAAASVTVPALSAEPQLAEDDPIDASPIASRTMLRSLFKSSPSRAGRRRP